MSDAPKNNMQVAMMIVNLEQEIKDLKNSVQIAWANGYRQGKKDAMNYAPVPSLEECVDPDPTSSSSSRRG